MEDIPVISSLKELLNEISWSWDYPRYDFIKINNDSYSLNKLYIDREQVTYKTDSWYLAPGVFEQFENFLACLEQSENSHENND